MRPQPITPLPTLAGREHKAAALRRRFAAASPGLGGWRRTTRRVGFGLLFAYWGACLAVIAAGAAKVTGLEISARAVIHVPAKGFTGCREVEAAGAGTLYFWEPGYREGMDGDGDGAACERNTPRPLWSRLEVD